MLTHEPPTIQQIPPRAGFNRRSLLVLTFTSLSSGALLVILLLRLIGASQATADPLSPIVGHPAPDFTISTWTWDGSPSQTIHLAALKGHPAVVNFWASWCQACREEQPVLEAAYLKYQAQGVIFIGVAFHDTQRDGTAFLKQFDVTFPSGPDTTGEISISYGLTGIPETSFITRDGVVAQKQIGAVDDGGLDSSIQALLR